MTRPSVSNQLESIISTSPQTPNTSIPTPDDLINIRKHHVESTYSPQVIAEIVKAMRNVQEYAVIELSGEREKHWDTIMKQVKTVFLKKGWNITDKKKKTTRGMGMQEYETYYWEITWAEDPLWRGK
jgi:hypothetical protein